MYYLFYLHLFMFHNQNIFKVFKVLLQMNINIYKTKPDWVIGVSFTGTEV